MAVSTKLHRCFELATVVQAVSVSNGHKDVVDVTGPFLRLCVAFEKMYPRIRGCQLEVLTDLCVIATEQENCFLMVEDSWLKTTIFFTDPDRFFGDHKQYGKDELKKIICDAGGAITIRRNVLPRQGYWMKLREFYLHSRWKRGFFTHDLLAASRLENRSLMEMLKEQRRRGISKERCALARSFMCEQRAPSKDHEVTISEPANPTLIVKALRVIDPEDLMTSAQPKLSNSGNVSKIVWGNCTYAMKWYDLSDANEDLASYMNIEFELAEKDQILHPHIMQAFGRCNIRDEMKACLIMELLDADLYNLIVEKARDPEIVFSHVDKLDVLLQIASAMKRLHENNVVHGDLKPSNILVCHTEVSENVQHFFAKVADFDGAKIIIAPASRFEPTSYGTTSYASPELLRCREAKKTHQCFTVDRKSDVYSFGVIAYEVLTEDKAYGSRGLDSKMKNEVMEGKRKLIDCSAWRNLKTFFRCLPYYEYEVIALVESCLDYDSVRRPDFSEICDDLAKCKAHLQELETKLRACRKVFVCISASIAILFFLLYYASEVWIDYAFRMCNTSVILLISKGFLAK